MIKHTRLERSTASSTASIRPAANRGKDSASGGATEPSRQEKRFTLGHVLLQHSLGAVSQLGRGWRPGHFVQVVQKEHGGLSPLCLLENVLEDLPHCL